MADSIVRDFLIDCQTVTEAEVHSFASSIRENNELIDSLILVFEERQYHKEFLEPLCEQLFAFFRAQEEPLRQFAMFFVPCIVGVYLASVHKGERKAVRCIELLLLGAYNLQILDGEGKPAVTTCTVPSISKPSIYHEPMAVPQAQLTENALSKLEHGDNKITQGPYSTIESLNASNRLHVALVLIRAYNQNISIVPQCSRASLCKTCSRLVNQGTAPGIRRAPLDGPNRPSFAPRVHLSSQLLLEFLRAIYFSMFNGLFSLGHQALSDIHRRAMQSTYTDVLLVTNAIKNSLESHPGGHPADGPMGIGVATSPAASTTTVSKAIVTNASFRTKKLPDDIPIVKEGEAAGGHEGLDAIREEGAAQSDEQTSSREPAGAAQGAARAVKAVLPSMPRIIPGVTKVVKAIAKRDDARSRPVEIHVPAEEESGEVALAVANPFVDLQITKRDPGEKKTAAETGRSSERTSYAEESATPVDESSKEVSATKRTETEGKKSSSSGSKRGSATPSGRKASSPSEGTTEASKKETSKKASSPSEGTAEEAGRKDSGKSSEKKQAGTASSEEHSGAASPKEKKSASRSTSETKTGVEASKGSKSASVEKKSASKSEEPGEASKGKRDSAKSREAEASSKVPNGVEQPHFFKESSSKHGSVTSSMLQQLATADHTTTPSVVQEAEKPKK